uniref:Gap junction protein epsilon 1 n=1 Tax=Corvus moneduloides TaxID=1196302 RepID=A0A8U7MWJ6_CORMO
MLRLAGSRIFPPAAAPRALRRGLNRDEDGDRGGERLRGRAGVMVGTAGAPGWRGRGSGAGAQPAAGRRWRPALLTVLPGDYRRAPAGPAFAAPAAGPRAGARPGTKGGASRGRGRGRGQGGLRLRPPPTQGTFPSHVPQLHPELLGGMSQAANGNWSIPHSFFGSIRMFFLGVLGFAVYGNEALHFSCDPEKREVNLFCYNQFRPITPQVFWALQLVIVLVPGAFFHLYAACKSIKQEDILQKSSYTGFYIFSVFLRIVLEVVAFWLQIQLFGFKVNAIYMCDVGALEKKFNITRCMVPEHFEKTIFLIAMYTFTVITVILCVAEIFEISCRRLGFLKTQ